MVLTLDQGKPWISFNVIEGRSYLNNRCVNNEERDEYELGVVVGG